MLAENYGMTVRLSAMTTHSFASGLKFILGEPTTGMSVQEMEGGASNRTYHRVTCGAQSWVVMVLADEPLRSEEASSGPIADELPFVEMQRFLEAQSVRVPVIHRYDKNNGHIWLEDLGDVVLGDTLLDATPTERVHQYCEAVDLLVQFQIATAGTREKPICYKRRFEPALLRWELDHYREWRLETQLGRTLHTSVKTALEEEFDRLVERLVGLPQILCHRDFQSRNLMVLPNDELVLIDFQDALVGSFCYDLVALTRDSYIQLTDDQVDAIVGHYLARRTDLDKKTFRAAFHWQTIQRKLKDSGRFVYIDRVKKNPDFLRFIEPSLGYVRAALEKTPELSRLHELLVELDPEAFA
jgi:hypothetical protein